MESDSAPPVAGPWSQAVRIEPSLVFLSGQGPFDKQGNRVGKSITDQTRQTLQNLAAVAAAAGGTMSDIVRVGIYLRNMVDWHEMNEEYRTHFEPPYPARTTIQSDLSGFDVEIDAIMSVSKQ